MKRTGPTNQNLKKLIEELRQSELPIWKRTARELEKATRKRREVNLNQISRSLRDGSEQSSSHLQPAARDGETALVPGKVLGAGTLSKKATVVGWRFSESALKKIREAGGKAITIQDYFKQYQKGSRVRIVG